MFKGKVLSLLHMLMDNEGGIVCGYCEGHDSSSPLSQHFANLH